MEMVGKSKKEGKKDKITKEKYKEAKGKRIRKISATNGKQLCLICTTND
jgi:hypothetical protein